MKKLSGVQKVVILLLIPTIFLGGYQFYIETVSETAIEEVFKITEQALLESNPEISDEELDMALQMSDSFYSDNYWSFENWMYLGLWILILIVAFSLFKKQ